MCCNNHMLCLGDCPKTIKSLNDTVGLGCQYTDLYSLLICFMFIKIILDF